MNIFITGLPGIGKTTVVKRVIKVLEKEGFKAGGIICLEIREGANRVGFEVIDILTENRGILSHVRQARGPTVGKYRVNLEVLSSVGVRAIEFALEKADYVVIDEIGPMELQGADFQQIVLGALEGSKPVFGILHWKMNHPLINTIKARSDVKLYELTRENRDTIHENLIKEMHKMLTSSSHSKN